MYYKGFAAVADPPPSYEESLTPTLPGLFMSTDQLDAVVQVRGWWEGADPGLVGTTAPFNGTGGTGVLIGPRLVLTAKHVVAERTRERANAVPATKLDVVFGPKIWPEDPQSVVPVYAVEVIDPGVALGMSSLPRGTPLADYMRINHADLALLLLSRPAPARPIPLAPAEPAIGQYLQLSGYGNMEIGGKRGWAVGTVTHFAEDRSGFLVRATGSMESNTSPGPGDSGGPAISISPSGSPQVSGVVSGGKWLFSELERMRMELYASVAPHRDWIDTASSRLLAEDWQHDTEKSGGGAAGRSMTVPLIVGGVALVAFSYLIFRKGSADA
jgi:hypothetical protein